MTNKDKSKRKVTFNLENNKITIYNSNFSRTYSYNQTNDTLKLKYKQIVESFEKEYHYRFFINPDEQADSNKNKLNTKNNQKVNKLNNQKNQNNLNQIKNCLKMEEKIYSQHNSKKFKEGIFDNKKNQKTKKIKQNQKEENDFDDSCGSIDLSELKTKKYDLSNIF